MRDARARPRPASARSASPSPASPRSRRRPCRAPPTQLARGPRGPSAPEPVGVVEEDLDRDRVDVAGRDPALLEVAPRACATPAASRCQSGPERRNMPAGMCSRQNPIGRPRITVSMPCSRAQRRRRQRVRSRPYHQQLSVQRRSPVLGPVSADHTLGPRDVASMTRSVIVSAVRTPVGKFGAGLRGCSATDLGAVAIREAVARADLPPDEVDYVLMGHVLQAGAGQITLAAGRGRRRDPSGGPGHHPQQRLPVEPDRGRLRRPAHPAGRDRDRRRRRHGVDDQRPVRAAQGALGPAPRRRRGRRRDDPRRPVVDVHRPAHGRVLRRGQRRARDLPRGAGRLGGAVAPARGRRRGSRAASPTRSSPSRSAAQGRPGSSATRASGPARTAASLAELPPAFGVRRHDHRRQRVAALRRRRRGRRHAPRARGRARGRAAGRDRGVTACRAERFAYLHTVPAIALQNGAEEGRARGRRPRGDRDQRGLRVRRRARHAHARRQRGAS